MCVTVTSNGWQGKSYELNHAKAVVAKAITANAVVAKSVVAKAVTV